MSRRIFICSTCYDLIDIRAELAAFLRSIDLEPALSEEISGFKVEADRNSIDSCLVNVRRSERVIVILNQRYGPRLGKVGFEDISASHLEYKTAVDARIPIDFFVRDRMEADFNHWEREKKKGNELNDNLDWVKKKDFGLFSWLEEHKKLNLAEDRPNWYYSFSNVVDLKARLERILDHEFLPARIIDAMQMGQFPAVALTTSAALQGRMGSATVEVRSISNAPCFDFSCSWEGEKSASSSQELILYSSQVIPMSFRCVFKPLNAAETRILEISYRSAIGIRVEERHEITLELIVGTSKLSYGDTLISRRYHRCDPLSVEIEFDSESN